MLAVQSKKNQRIAIPQHQHFPTFLKLFSSFVLALFLIHYFYLRLAYPSIQLSMDIRHLVLKLSHYLLIYGSIKGLNVDTVTKKRN